MEQAQLRRGTRVEALHNGVWTEGIVIAVRGSTCTVIFNSMAEAVECRLEDARISHRAEEFGHGVPSQIFLPASPSSANVRALVADSTEAVKKGPDRSLSFDNLHHRFSAASANLSSGQDPPMVKKGPNVDSSPNIRASHRLENSSGQDPPAVKNVQNHLADSRTPLHHPLGNLPHRLPPLPNPRAPQRFADFSTFAPTSIYTAEVAVDISLPDAVGSHSLQQQLPRSLVERFRGDGIRNLTNFGASILLGLFPSSSSADASLLSLVNEAVVNLLCEGIGHVIKELIEGCLRQTGAGDRRTLRYLSTFLYYVIWGFVRYCLFVITKRNSARNSDEQDPENGTAQII